MNFLYPPLPCCNARDTRDSVAEDMSVSAMMSAYVLPSMSIFAALDHLFLLLKGAKIFQKRLHVGLRLAV